MRPNLLRWSAVLGAVPRILQYRQVLERTHAYFDRLRIVNEALGPHWVFRLADAVGLDTIKANRPSWYGFYVEDVDRLHCPLDPGAPETEPYLGRKYSDMDMAFYAGMGFDGYRLALQTARHVNISTKELMLDGRYVLAPLPDMKVEMDAYEKRRSIPKEDYYSAYGDALSVLYEQISSNSSDEEVLERIATGCLILLCGGHKGCKKHITREEEFGAQMESLIIFKHAHSALTGAISLEETISPRIHAVS
jgi:hypothetical protein